MHIIKLDATDSTNSYLRILSTNAPLPDYTVVTAKHQTNGRGQRGTTWRSDSDKNLMCSVFKDVSFIKFRDNFYISIVTSLAIIKTLQQFLIPKLSIKWPNDIMSEDKKICGILIENIIKQHAFGGTIIGIGLNVNQIYFNNLPNATSMQYITGTPFNTDELLQSIVKNLKFYFDQLQNDQHIILKNTYESYLFRKNKPSTFRDQDNNLFTGYIQGISNSGSLRILLEDEIIAEYELKEIALLY
ncbi:biotin--[acetyl-CoA-carboxylase] ligase [Bizionia argentinensis JUB59]|uniref:Biotin--[acetyl-CoA-carboxylase] ligase n=1 Tax=Bizionia argentinensis JUB59 TaxID=1046627 RepID=G2EAA7_9FLAO|nr:biotin--[acetyl-CoA-carboxylase] ligase [Bizionia argentinensis]EGV44732.1 biotin--[acetyl-CoA-carboxylase] ligase [Bizionia argentinensis JUB59]